MKFAHSRTAKRPAMGAVYLGDDRREIPRRRQAATARAHIGDRQKLRRRRLLLMR